MADVMSEDPLYASVVLDNYLDRALEYLIPSHLQAHIDIGSRVEVPLKNRLKKGYVWKISPNKAYTKVKPIHTVLPKALSIPTSLMELASFLSSYYLSPLWHLCKSIMPPSIREERKEKKIIEYFLLQTKEKSLQEAAKLQLSYPTQAKVLSLLLSKGALCQQEILENACCSTSPLKTLEKKKLLGKREKVHFEDSSLDFLPTSRKKLTEEQQIAFDTIHSTLEKGTFQTHLIHGVTGSGKTEIYLQLTEEALKKDKSVLLMVPEVALTSQLIETFQARLQRDIAIWHHKRSLSKRYSTWQKIREGKLKVIIGARSSIFCPAKLGLIIVDEEHDPSYKQSDEMPCYNARDLAVYRGKLEEATVVLGSATPSIESYSLAQRGKYQLLQLPTRATKAKLPTITIVDQTKMYEKAQGFTHFSDELLQGIKERIERGEQSLILLNRRGYRNMMLCPKCGESFCCPHCSRSLTYHKKKERLLCHLCGYQEPRPSTCPCGNRENLQFKGYGTEHVERSIKAIFPSIRTLRMDRDTTAKKEAHEELFSSFRAGKADLLIGTQMISKGFHFPLVTLVGILQSDVSLQVPDFRSEEFLFQQIVQVAGRAGRADLPGNVIIQSFRPSHPLIQLAAKGDYLSFYERQMEERKLFSYPPYSRMIKIVASGKEEKKVKDALQSFHNRLQDLPVKLFPITSSGYAKVKDRYRFQFLLLCKKILPVTSAIKERMIFPSGIHFHVDVDPLATFL